MKRKYTKRNVRYWATKKTAEFALPYIHPKKINQALVDMGNSLDDRNNRIQRQDKLIDILCKCIERL